MITPERIRMMVVDNNQAVRRGLGIFLRAYDDLELAGEADNGAQALRLCAEAPPDVVLIDVGTPEVNGLAAIRTICQTYARVKVIALTSIGKEDLVISAIEAGAVGYLLKNVSADELAQAVRMAYAAQP